MRPRSATESKWTASKVKPDKRKHPATTSVRPVVPRFYWTVGDGSQHALIAIAVGNFVDQDFPAPMREYYTTMRHGWVSTATDAEQFPTFPEERDRFQGFGG